MGRFPLAHMKDYSYEFPSDHKQLENHTKYRELLSDRGQQVVFGRRETSDRGTPAWLTARRWFPGRSKSQVVSLRWRESRVQKA